MNTMPEQKEEHKDQVNTDSASVKSTKTPIKSSSTTDEVKNKWNNIVILGLSEKLSKMINKHHVPVRLKPSNAMR